MHLYVTLFQIIFFSAQTSQMVNHNVTHTQCVNLYNHGIIQSFNPSWKSNSSEKRCVCVQICLPLTVYEYVYRGCLCAVSEFTSNCLPLCVCVCVSEKKKAPPCLSVCLFLCVGLPLTHPSILLIYNET